MEKISVDNAYKNALTKSKSVTFELLSSNICLQDWMCTLTVMWLAAKYSRCMLIVLIQEGSARGFICSQRGIIYGSLIPPTLKVILKEKYNPK